MNATHDLVEVTIGDRSISMPKEIANKLSEDGGNLEDFRKSLTQKAQDLATGERTLAAGQEELAMNKATLATDRATPPMAERPQPEGLKISDLPNQVDDPEGYNAGLQRLLDERDVSTELRLRNEFDKAAGKIAGDAEQDRSADNARRNVTALNEKVIADYIERMRVEGTPMTTVNIGEMRKYLDSQLRKPGTKYASRDQESGSFLFTEDAAEASDHAVRPDYWKNRNYDAGLKDGLARAADAGAADLGKGAPGAPQDSASSREKVEYALKLPHASQKQQEYVDSLTNEELDLFITEEYAMAGEEGALSAIGE